MRAQTDINEVLEVAREIDSGRIDYNADTNALFVADTGTLGLKEGSIYTPVSGPFGSFDAEGPAPMHMTDHALSQIAQRLGISYGPAFFKNNRDLPQHLVAEILNHYLYYRDPKQVLLRQFGNQVRGVCGSTYLIMDHSWMLELAREFLTDDNGNVAPHLVVPGWRVEPDYMNVKLIMRNELPGGGVDGNYGMGVALRNGTVANASVGVESLIMRGACTNSIRLRDQKWTIRHVGSTEILATREALVITALAEGFQKSYDLAERLVRARRQRLPNIFDVIGGIVDGQKLNEDLTSVISAGTEGRQDLAALVNGITWAAQPQNNNGILDADTSEDLEAFAGELLELADGQTDGNALAQQLFSLSRTKAHVTVGRDE